MTFSQTVDYIESIPGFTKKRALDNTKALLHILGDPQEKLKIIHVAGTNGKGSVCAFLNGMLMAGGQRVGLFTSPHLITIRERFMINRELIREEDFAAASARVQEAVCQLVENGGEHPAYFEWLLAMAMVYFSGQHCDYMIMEAGLGGLKDATNVIEHPVLSVITSISLDHTEYLGSTVEEIAAQKAGIMKAGVPVVCDGSDSRAAKVFTEHAAQVGSPLTLVYPGMCEVREQTDKSVAFVLNNRYYDYVYVKTPFAAAYQVMNTALAMTALKQLPIGRGMTRETILKAISETRWKGRMEMVAPGILVDGAHNIGGIESFAVSAKALGSQKPIHLLFAAVVEKDFENMIRVLCTDLEWKSITVTQIEGHRKVEAEEFAGIFHRYTSAPVYVEKDIPDALHCASRCTEEGELLLCCGSLYLVGEIEEIIGKGQK